MPHHPWTTEIITYLAQLWEEGILTGKMGEFMRRKFPDYPGQFIKNTIIGKIARLREKGDIRFPPRVKVIPSDPANTRKSRREYNGKVQGGRKHYSKRLVKNELRQKYSIRGVPIPGELEPMAFPKEAFGAIEGQPTKTLDELNYGDCRWPIDTEGNEINYCGAPVAHGPRTRYCPTHKAMNTSPSERRVSKRLTRLADIV